MYKFMVEIGSINGGQKRYLVTAATPEAAKKIALAKYTEQGLKLDGNKKVYASYRGRA